MPHPKPTQYINGKIRNVKIEFYENQKGAYVY